MQDDTPTDGAPRRIIAVPGLTPRELRRRDKQHARVEKWKAEAVAGSMSRGDRVRIAIAVGCMALVLACLYVPVVTMDGQAFRLIRAWRWVWEPYLAVEIGTLCIQVVVVAALTAVAALVAGRDAR